MYRLIALSLSIDAALFAFTPVSTSLRAYYLPTPHTTPRPCPWTTGVIKAGESEALWGYRYSRATVRESLGSLRALHLRPFAISSELHEYIRLRLHLRMSDESFPNQQVMILKVGVARDAHGDVSKERTTPSAYASFFQRRAGSAAAPVARTHVPRAAKMRSPGREHAFSPTL